MHVVFTLGLWGSTIGGAFVGLTALTFYSLKRFVSIRGSPSWESWIIENLAITFIAGAAFSFVGSIMLAVERILTLTI